MAKALLLLLLPGQMKAPCSALPHLTEQQPRALLCLIPQSSSAGAEHPSPTAVVRARVVFRAQGCTALRGAGEGGWRWVRVLPTRNWVLSYCVCTSGTLLFLLGNLPQGPSHPFQHPHSTRRCPNPCGLSPQHSSRKPPSCLGEIPTLALLPPSTNLPS